MKKQLLTLLFSACLINAYAEDGSRLWLRADTTAQATVTANRQSPVIAVAVKELQTQWRGAPVQLLIAGTKAAQTLGSDGYTIAGNPQTGVTLTAAAEQGLLYGAYHLLRLQETGALAGNINITEKPGYERRILNHWDNLDRSIERGYAGRSLWEWEKLPDTLSPRYREYARANASIGINGSVLNNVNANPQILSGEYLAKVKAIADVFRPYGIKVYLSVNFASPKTLGGLPDADPLNREVIQWWKNKVKEIYALIPDFGGFLVKANSEGQSGPQDYGRTHADGANMLADALKPYKGIVMWRAFVYSPTSEDRAKQAYQEFVPLDGQFRDNVIIQIKNGPVDFQPREPFSPLFGALQHTQEMIEFQITQEYLGFSNHLVYLAPLFKETLDSDTYAGGQGATVAKITNGALRPAKVTAIAGVANTGDSVNWCGHHFAQANWYAFGRLAWNSELSAEQIAEEWLKMTFTADENFVRPAADLMLASREACVNYMMPLGLHHIFSFNAHYGPQPWGYFPGGRMDWMPVYYHKADSAGVGFDRSKTGSNAVSQYFQPLGDLYGDIDRCPENLLLWFHHAAWTHKMKSGNSLWDELCYRYDSGVRQARDLQKAWDRLERHIDAERFDQVQAKLQIQAKDAVWWKDACLLYFQTFSKMPIPYEIERPVHRLDDLYKVWFRQEDVLNNNYCIK
ncbi:MAG: alpha-glucuronidase [Dysgonamonadaceae bacterium]|jgi:alpha-glucuronidase|nr:alpha-glucuronidase [Dysgonamonadaceae bacterium]